MSIIRLQGDEGLTWDEACTRASTLLDTGKEVYTKSVRKEAQSLYKSRHMTEMNKSRKKWVEEGYRKGVEEYKITYPCSVCGGELVLKPGEKDHEAMKGFMRQAGWAHSSCIKN
ncbi:hypothetical protein ACFL0D_09425 [Thermoproteota archaeon]